MLKYMFAARWWQVLAYFFGVALFSISFLVFLNATVSFVITDLIGSKNNVGNDVGNLGFADELVALVACPVWGTLSDRLGVRLVCVIGYTIIGIALFVFVQARNVYPQLLLARLLFSIGGAACTTMVTAILPTMVRTEGEDNASGEAPLFQTYTPENYRNDPNRPRHGADSPISSEATLTPTRYRSVPSFEEPHAAATATPQGAATPPRRAGSVTAGLVGMFTGIGALVALGAFLPLPSRFQKAGQDPGSAIMHSYYVVGSIALGVAVFCFVGLSKLSGEEGKGFRALFSVEAMQSHKITRAKTLSYTRALAEAVILAGKDMSIGLGYLGGFVARASSVGISTFIPLYVNAYFIKSGLCDEVPGQDPSLIKKQCRQAYVTAAILTGTSQLVALLCAPVFGFLDVKFQRFNSPILVASAAGILGYTLFAKLNSPLPSGDHGSPAVFLLMVLIGISQIGAIVCSLSMLGRGIQGDAVDQNAPHHFEGNNIQSDGLGNPNASSPEPQSNQDSEQTGLLGRHRVSHLPSHLQSLSGSSNIRYNRGHLKGSIAGLYSLSGGAGILLLTKLGGYLFDKTSTGAPFYMMAVFNAILFVGTLGCGIVSEFVRRKQSHALQI